MVRPIKRKADTGEAGNPGQFGTLHRGESDVTVDVSGSDTMADRASLEGMPYEDQPKMIADVAIYDLDYRGDSILRECTEVDVTGYFYDHPEEVQSLVDDYGIELDGSTVRGDDDDEMNFEGDPASGDRYLDEEGFVEATGPGGTDADVASAFANYVDECRQRGVRPFSDIEGHRLRMIEKHGRQKEEALKEARFAIERAARNYPDHYTPSQARAAAAQELYRDIAREETSGAIDDVKAWGAENGAAYVAFPGDDDYESTSLLSSFPVFYDKDGARMDEIDDFESTDAWDRWNLADRDEEIVEDIKPERAISEELGAKAKANGERFFDDRYVYRCEAPSQEA